MIQLEQEPIAVAPQIHRSMSTASMMWSVSVCLLPAAIWGVYVFGAKALTVLIVSVLSSVLTELLLGLATRKFTVGDGSAFLTGVLIGFCLSPTVPLYIPVVASVFAIAVVKWSFGGLGSNWMNPALAGRVFVFFSWNRSMTSWQMPVTLLPGGRAIDAVTHATPLTMAKAGLEIHGGTAAGPMQVLLSQGYPHTAVDTHFTAWLNALFPGLGGRIQGGYLDLFLGNVSGSIGEVSVCLLLLGTIYLFARRIITWHVPVACLGSYALLEWAFGGLMYGNRFGTGDALFGLLTGGIILGAFYMATDVVTSPLSKEGMLLYGAGIGVLTFVLRAFGVYPEGVGLAIILMNVFVPLINRYVRPRRFGSAEGR